MDFGLDFFAGSVAGFVGVLIGHPLDTVKVRMQTSTLGSTSGCISNIFAKEGFPGFFKGLPPPLVSVMIYQATAFAAFSASLKLVTNDSEDTASLPALFVAGTLAGVATVPVTTPTDLVKIRMQLDLKGQQGLRGMLHCARMVYRAEGVSGILRGAEATALRDTGSTGLYFLSYHWSKRWLREGEQGWDQNSSELMAGGIAGVMAWGSVVPFDSVKTQLQGCRDPVPPRPLALLASQIQSQGLTRLYRGTGPLLLRAFVVNAVTFYAYEETWRTLRLFLPKKPSDTTPIL